MARLREATARALLLALLSLGAGLALEAARARPAGGPVPDGGPSLAEAASKPLPPAKPAHELDAQSLVGGASHATRGFSLDKLLFATRTAAAAPWLRPGHAPRAPSDRGDPDGPRGRRSHLLLCLLLI